MADSKWNKDTWPEGYSKEYQETPPIRRYVSNSERSRMLLEGAALYGRAMDSQKPEDSSDWMTWAKANPGMVAAVTEIQAYAWDKAQRFPTASMQERDISEGSSYAFDSRHED